MKLIIAGSRTITSLCPYWFRDVFHHYNIDPRDPNNVTEIVSGTAEGIDQLGERFAKRYHIPLKQFPADWEKYGKKAGPIRNKQMAEYADVLLLIWDGESKGSANMKKEMKKLKKPIYEVIIKHGH